MKRGDGKSKRIIIRLGSSESSWGTRGEDYDARPVVARLGKIGFVELWKSKRMSAKVFSGLIGWKKVVVDMLWHRSRDAAEDMSQRVTF